MRTYLFFLLLLGSLAAQFPVGHVNHATAVSGYVPPSGGTAGPPPPPSGETEKPKATTVQVVKCHEDTAPPKAPPKKA